MRKGVQKNMIWVRTPESRCFEAAYFVLRPQRRSDTLREGEMIREANRLLLEDREHRRPSKGRWLRQRILPFLIGVRAGLCLCLPVVLLAVR